MHAFGNPEMVEGTGSKGSGLLRPRKDAEDTEAPHFPRHKIREKWDIHPFSYFTSMVETLKGGSVTVNDVPLAGICETSTGCTGLCP